MDKQESLAHKISKQIEFAIDDYIVNKNGIHGVIADHTNKILAAHNADVTRRVHEGVIAALDKLPLKCENCGHWTSYIEAKTRLFNCGRCGKCGGYLAAEYYSIDAAITAEQEKLERMKQ